MGWLSIDRSNWEEIVFDNPIKLTKDVQYLIMVQAPYGEQSCRIAWRVNLSSGDIGYIRGNSLTSSDNGSSWVVQDGDVMFEEY